MHPDERYVFTAERRQALEDVPLALAVYQFVQGKIVTLLVSDGMCSLYGIQREDLMDSMDHDMFARVHPEDVEMVAALGYRFATCEGPYDIVYRTRLSNYPDYRSLHVTGKYQTLEHGLHLAYLFYTDVTNTAQHQLLVHEQVSLPKVRYMDEFMGALAIVSRVGERLLYTNKAMMRLLPPKRSFDSGITFCQFFFGDDSIGFDRLFQAPDKGVRTVEDPITHRKFDVNLLSCTYADEPAYSAYFFESLSDISLDYPPVVKLHSRATFDFAILSGEDNGLPYFISGYQGYCVWNLSQNTLVLSNACPQLFADCGDAPAYDCCQNRLIKLVCDVNQRELLRPLSRERMLHLYETGTYPREFSLTLQTDHGIVYVIIYLTMMNAPESNDVYLKVEEKNVSDDAILYQLVEKTVEEDYDFVAYSDLSSDLCRIISGAKSASGRNSRVIKTSEHISKPSDIRSFPFLFPNSVHTLAEMHDYLLSACGTKGSYTTLQELPGGIVKSIYFELVSEQSRSFFIRCKDVTALLRKEREQKSELEAAVRAEHDKVERVLVQTVLSISNALDARDPLTRRHSQRVAQYSADMAQRLNWSEESIQNLYNIALVHDIGKIGIPDAVLQKKGKLTSEEYLEIQNHVAIGAFILKDFTAFQRVAEGALFHHERYDGKGYLRGLAGEQIPIEARIIGLADAVDAMNNTRPYRASQNEGFIRSELIAGRGKQFDPKLVDIMLEMIDGGVLNG